MPVHQDVAPKNLFSGCSSEGRGTLPSMEGLNAMDNSQNVFLGQVVIFASEQEASDAILKVPLELAIPSEFAKEDPADMDSMNSDMQETNTNGCMTLIGPGDGDLKDYVQRSELPMRAIEDCGALSIQQLLDRMGPDPQLSPSDAELSSPDLNGKQGSSESMGPGTTSHANNLSSTAFVDVVRRGLMASAADLPSRCAAPFPIFEEDRLAALDSSPWVANCSGPSPCANQQNMEARTGSRIGELRRNIVEMRSHFEAIRSRSASPPFQ
ncbi:hypothetical protein Nepgr_000908 [Nepenthes gracilis]|uniref:Uncharacterized protein n=1 Tax=Nepenthes gracilis TaxID=150966 RepID=A0AAD3P3L7_NEPGR|nr:hypothetical protein Nepgr_000908 [Nepenthes gracilis]